MATKVTCEKCGQPVSVSREQQGGQVKCPHCGNETYVPAPEDEIEELPLAPEDESERQREERLQAERRRIDRILASEEGDEAGAGKAGGAPAPHARAPRSAGGQGGISVKEVVMRYLTAMRDADLDRADEALSLLAMRRDDALRIVDELASDQIPPAEMSSVPAGVYQGFLKTLRSQL